MPNSIDSLKARLASYFRELIPIRRVTVSNNLAEPNYRASLLDVDALHAALRAAEGGQVEDLFAIYRDTVLSDPHVQSEFMKRKLAVIGDTLSVQPVDKTKPEDVAAAEAVEYMLDQAPGMLVAYGHILDSTLWPVSVVEKVWKPTPDGPYDYCLAELVHVPYRLLDYSTGRLMIYDADPQIGARLATRHEPLAHRYIVHRGHLLSTPDNWGGPLRSILFWWLLGNMDRDWWARFLDQYGAPFLVGKYDQSDDQSRSILERAFSLATRIGGLVISKETDVEIKQAAQQSAGDAFEKFYTISRREISKLILGQTLSAEAQNTGLGSGVAKQQGDVRQDYRQFDARMLGATLRDQLFRPFLSYNGLKGEPPRAIFGGITPEDIEATSSLIAALNDGGLEVDDDGLKILNERIGIPIRRKTATNPMPGLAAFDILPRSYLQRAEDAGDSIARKASADLAQAFRGSLAPLRRIVLESQSADEVLERIKDTYPDWTPERAASVIESALVAFAANGAGR